MEITESISERGKKLLIVQQYKFYLYKVLKKTKEECWSCTKRGCNVKLYLLGGAYSRLNGIHNHDSDNPQLLNRQKLSNKVKQAATENLLTKPRKLIHQEINKDSDVLITLSSNDFELIGKNVNNARRKMVPKLSKTWRALQESLNEMEVKTAIGENFLLVNDMVQEVVIFSCFQNLSFLCEHQESVYMDGTFENCAKHFLQLFTIHCYVSGNYIPVAFCLLKNKTMVSYTNLFRLVKAKCLELGFNLNPKHIVVDFEPAIHNSVKEVFSDSKIIGCRFHLTQSWWRKIQSLGLSNDYTNNESEIGKWIHFVFGLLYLPHEEVGDAFVEDLMSIMPVNEKLSNWADYLVNTYISEDATFPPQMWAALTASTTRTTNNCEAFHSVTKVY